MSQMIRPGRRRQWAEGEGLAAPSVIPGKRRPGEKKKAGVKWCVMAWLLQKMTDGAAGSLSRHGSGMWCWRRQGRLLRLSQA